jgi:hypothetical protein
MPRRSLPGKGWVILERLMLVVQHQPGNFWALPAPEFDHVEAGAARLVARVAWKQALLTVDGYGAVADGHGAIADQGLIIHLNAGGRRAAGAFVVVRRGTAVPG